MHRVWGEDSGGVEVSVRKPSVAGMFYPDDKKELQAMIARFLKNVPPMRTPTRLRALIVPHAGYEYSGQVAAYGYSLLKGSKVQKVVLLGPSHYVYMGTLVSDVHNSWETPLGVVNLLPHKFASMKDAHAREHCLEVQIPFLQTVLPRFEVLPLLAGDMDPSEAARQLQTVINEDTLLIISSDLSHYHDYAQASGLDRVTVDAIGALDVDRLAGDGEACGKMPILALLLLAKRLHWTGKLLKYQNSGDVTGEKGHVVGYASFAFIEK